MNFYYKLLFVILILLWLLGIFSEVIIPHFDSLAFLYPYLKFLYSHVCHQQPEKVLSIDAHNLLVCSRCTGIYLGSFISSLILLLVPVIKIRNIIYLLLATIPMVIDVILYSSGIYTYSKNIALFSGTLFGIAGIIYIYNGLQILLVEKEKGKS